MTRTFRVKRVEVVPKRERFGIEHKLFLEGKTRHLKELFGRYPSAEFEVRGNSLRLRFSRSEEFLFILERTLEDYYGENINEFWRSLIVQALGTEEPFRFFSFYTESGEYLGTVGVKRDYESGTPVVVVYDKF